MGLRSTPRKGLVPGAGFGVTRPHVAMENDGSYGYPLLVMTYNDPLLLGGGSTHPTGQVIQINAKGFFQVSFSNNFPLERGPNDSICETNK